MRHLLKRIGRFSAPLLCAAFLLLPVSVLGQDRSYTGHFQWVPLHWHGGKLTEVGGSKLPVPLMLPVWLHPLGNKVLFGHVPLDAELPDNAANRVSMLSIMLDPGQSERVQKWLQDFPRNPILPPKTYTYAPAKIDQLYEGSQVIRPRVLTKVDTDGEKGWDYTIALVTPAKSPRIVIDLTVSSTDLPIPANQVASYEDTMPGFPDALTSPLSPVKNKKHIIWLWFICCPFPKGK